MFPFYLGHGIQEWTEQNFLIAVFHKFYLVHLIRIVMLYFSPQSIDLMMERQLSLLRG